MTVRSIDPFRLSIEMRTFASRKETKRHEEIALLGDMADRNHRLRESQRQGGVGGSRKADADISRLGIACIGTGEEGSHDLLAPQPHALLAASSRGDEQGISSARYPYIYA